MSEITISLPFQLNSLFKIFGEKGGGNISVWARKPVLRTAE